MSGVRPVTPSRSWLRLDALLSVNPKIAALTDAEFRAWVLSLCSAKLQQSEGSWASEAYYRLGLGAYAEHLPALLAAGLLERDDDDLLVVHDWHEWQPKDETSAERSRRYRDRLKERREAVTRDATYATRGATQTRRDETRRDVTDETRVATQGTSRRAAGTPTKTADVLRRLAVVGGQYVAVESKPA